MTEARFFADISRRLAAGDIGWAEAQLNVHLSKHSDDAHAWFLMGRAARLRGDRQRALDTTRRAVTLAPDASEYRAQLARCLLDQGIIEDALAAAELAASDPMASDLTLDAIAAVHSRLNQHERAAALLRRAADQGGRNPAILFNLATALKFCGDFDAAARVLEDAIAIAPNYIRARAALTLVRPATAEHNQLAEYEALLDRTTDPAVLLHLCHSAARECEALGRYDDAFAFLRRGKATMLSIADYDIAQDRALFDAVREAFTTDIATTPEASTSDAAPIFVVGMPRSGTTVLERILSADPAVATVGESLALPQLLQRRARTASSQLIDPRSVSALTAPGALDGLADDYLKALPPVATGRRPLDKFHLNSLLVGFIVRAFPRAKVICVHRGGLDTIVGNFRQLFEYRSKVYCYALALDSLAHFYVEFRRMTAFWAQRFPDNVLSVGYEDLIAAPAATGQAIFDFCGLRWDEAYLRIEDNRSPVATASAVQIRKSLNARSIGSWKTYDPWLGYAKDILTKAGLPF